jgi:hypothetical protein
VLRFCSIWFALSLCCVPVAAGLNVATPFQDGSLLVFPKIEVSEDVDTIIRIVNSYEQSAWLKCFWEESDGFPYTFVIYLIKSVGTEFRASNGWGVEPGSGSLAAPFPGTKGSLTCWAVNPDGTEQISWNSLHGSATIYNFKTGSALEYKSWNFRAISIARGKAVGTPGTILLNGKKGGYDTCPQTLAFNFEALGGSNDNDSSQKIKFGRTELTLLPCKKDFRSDGKTPVVSKASFSIRNANLGSFSGSYACVTDYLAEYLDAIQSGGKLFTSGSLHSNWGYFSVSGVASSTCKGSQATGFLGMLVSHTDLNGNDAAVLSLPAQTGSNAGGFIYWDPPMLPE